MDVHLSRSARSKRSLTCWPTISRPRAAVDWCSCRTSRASAPATGIFRGRGHAPGPADHGEVPHLAGHHDLTAPVDDLRRQETYALGTRGLGLSAGALVGPCRRRLGTPGWWPTPRRRPATPTGLGGGPGRLDVRRRLVRADPGSAAARRLQGRRRCVPDDRGLGRRHGPAAGGGPPGPRSSPGPVGRATRAGEVPAGDAGHFGDDDGVGQWDRAASKGGSSSCVGGRTATPWSVDPPPESAGRASGRASGGCPRRASGLRPAA